MVSMNPLDKTYQMKNINVGGANSSLTGFRELCTRRKLEIVKDFDVTSRIFVTLWAA